MRQREIEFDAQAATAARDAAIAQVEANAIDSAKRELGRIVASLAAAGAAFTSDDVWRHAGQSVYDVLEPRALGAIMMQAARAGIITKTGEYRQSDRPVCHRNPKAVWIGKHE